MIPLRIKENALNQLWARGIIAPWYLKPHQESLYKLISTTVRDIIVPNISRRYGKSTTCVTYCVEEAIKKKQHIRYATAFLSDLQEFIKPIFDDVLNTCPQQLRPKYLDTKKLYIFPNGSKIKLVGLDKNPNGIRGNAIDILVIDEAAFVANLEYLYKSIIVPATMDRQFKIMFPSTPPLDPDHFWAKELCPKAMDRGTYLELTIDDNSSLSPAEKERLLAEVGGRDSATAQREFFCRVMADPDKLVIPEFDESCMKEFELPEYCFMDDVIDFGGSMDKHGVVLTYWDFERAKFCVIDEQLINQNTSTSTVIELCRALEAPYKPTTLRRMADAAGQTRIDLSSQDFFVSQPRKEKDSVEANINALRLAFQRGEVEIHPRCKKLRATLKFGSWLPTRRDWQRTTELGHLDLLAALLYAYRSVNKSNPFPPRHGRSWERNYVYDEAEDDTYSALNSLSQF